ncbi:asparagine synthase-related protein [Cytobacillus firmus]|uniref:asparagine synthase-related protein n=1 Tax=Cytobacillus firmus TaxID=1399 RepID=UPI001CFEA8C8|nr:asparagine synthase-related protein [Cytobacillus firmus]URT70234.1 asparagine synthase-related protein [Cytobacillus firmus]
MSAIAGIYNLNGEPVSIEQSSGMMKAFEKFPADDIQTWHKENIFLGCHAQWITPESIGEQLPFYDYQRQLAITADAIIDNREELFERLQIDREDRKKITDSQLILLAYHKWGEESPKFLVGDFAFMIWDEKERKMFGARDFSGARTLYYFRDNQRFGFSTTIKPLLSLPFVAKKLNEQWIAEYLANPGMFESVDSSITVYSNILQLPPSHSIYVENGVISLKRYCTLTDGTKLKLNSNEDYVDAFREVFQTAIQSKIRTHKKVGGNLSGGLDSGSVASFAVKELHKKNKKLYTFSYVPVDDFVDWTHRSRIANERKLIESTVNYVGNISPNYLSFENRSPYSEIDEWLEYLEMPYKFFENTFWLRGIYEEASHQGVGILLNGQRGNWTISWGRTFDYYALLIKNLKWIRLNQEMKKYSQIIGTGRKRILSVINKKLIPFMYQHHPLDKEFPMFINKDFAFKTKVLEKLKEHGIDPTGRVGTNAYKIRMQQFQRLYYWNTTGTYSAKLSLRYGLLGKDPTNDLRVIRFCLSVPEEQYVLNGQDRALIRRSTKGYLPDDIRLNMRTRGIQGADGVHRMKKDWGIFVKEIEQLLTDPLMREIVNIKVIEKCISRIGNDPKPENAFMFEFKVIMRSLILYRFLMRIN